MLFMSDISLIQYDNEFRVCPTLSHYRTQERRAQKDAPDSQHFDRVGTIGFKLNEITNPISD